MKTIRVTADDGRVYKLAPRKVVGEKPCSGEAHSNAFIDNCMACLNHRWGFVPDYAPTDVHEATVAGYAVPASDVDREVRKEAEGLKMVHVEQRYTGGSKCSFYVYVQNEGASMKRFAVK